MEINKYYFGIPKIDVLETYVKHTVAVILSGFSPRWMGKEGERLKRHFIEAYQRKHLLVIWLGNGRVFSIPFICIFHTSITITNSDTPIL